MNGLLNALTKLGNDPRRKLNDEVYDEWRDEYVAVELSLVTTYVKQLQLPAFMEQRLLAADFSDDDVARMVSELRHDVKQPR